MPMGVLKASLITVAALGLVACQEQSRVDADATITIAGHAVDPSGNDLAGRPVQLRAGISDAELGFSVLTFGTACVTGICTDDVRDTSTDDAGRYEFELTGRDTQSTFGEARLQLVSTSAAPGPGQVSGAAVAAEFRVQTEQIELPELVLVDPDLRLTDTGQVTAQWSGVAPGPYTLTFESPDPVPLWLTRTDSPQADVDPRLLEDTSGRAVVAGTRIDAIQGSEVRLHWRSPGVPYVSGTGAPPSRGQPCTPAGPAPGSPCPLTDGDLVRSAPPDPDATHAVVTLAEPVPAELVVVRGCSTTCNVEVSPDGAAYSARGSVSGEYGSVPLGGMPITAVRVSLPTDAPTGLREVSVWGPRPQVAPLEAVQEPPASLRQNFGTDVPVDPPDDDDDVPVLAVVAAAAALLAAGVGAGAALSRRRAR